jgi:hypothetical protein
MSGSFLASGPLEQPETNVLKNRPLGATVPDDRVGKVFGVVGENVRRCLICDKLFTHQAAAAHAETACRPPQRSFAWLGETDHANR